MVDYRETVPATIAGIEKYLGSGLIKGIGPVYARRITTHFREDTLRIINPLAVGYIFQNFLLQVFAKFYDTLPIAGWTKMSPLA